MPQILITKSLGPHVVAGNFRNWPQTVIDRISEQCGCTDWYVASQQNSPRRRTMAESPQTAKKRRVAANA
jgi:hypothetical protein